MKTYVVNIGLNNNPYHYSTCESMLANQNNSFIAFTNFRQADGEWDGQIEPTLVCKMHIVADSGHVLIARKVIRELCDMFTQDAIAIRSVDADDEGGELIYREGYDGQRYVFNSHYFLDPFKVR